MRFTTRLIAIVAVVIVAFSGVSVLSLRVLRDTQEISALQARLERLSSSTWHVQSLTFELLVTNSFRTIIPEWVDESASLESELAGIVEESQGLAAVASYLDETLQSMFGMTDQIDLLGESVSHFRTPDDDQRPGRGGNEPDGNGSPVRDIQESSAEESSDLTPA